MPAELPWTDASVVDEVRDALAAPTGPASVDRAPSGPAPIASAQSTVPRAEALALERRVQALERLLQALLAQLARSEPDLLARLEDAFSAPVEGVRADDDKAIDDCALALIHAALRTGDEVAKAPSEVTDASYPVVDVRRAEGRKDQLPFRPPSFHYRKVGGIWRLIMDRPPRPADKG